MKLTQLFWSFFGLLVPLVFAALFIPRLLEQIGEERFGVLAIAWGLLGWSGMLDLGIGRATTKLTASAIGRSDFDSIPGILKTAIRLSMVLSAGGAVILSIVLCVGANVFLKTEGISASELFFAAIALSVAFPFQALSSTYKGVNEAFLNLKAISLVRIGLGASTFALPLLISQFTNRVDFLVSSVLISRVLAFGFFRLCSWQCVRRASNAVADYSSDVQSKLLVFGGWFTVSCVINPIVASMDRLLLGTMVSTAIVATYALPYEICTQCMIAIGAISTIAFPQLSALLVRNHHAAWRKFNQIIGLSIGLISVIGLALFALGSTVLTVWLGKPASAESTQVIQILALGLLPMTIVAISIAYLHACDRTDITAKIHFAELFLFVPLTVYLIQTETVIGAAKAWVLRGLVDAVSLYIASIYVSYSLRDTRPLAASFET